MFVVDGPAATIEDLGSSHGTWMRGRRISGADAARRRHAHPPRRQRAAGRAAPVAGRRRAHAGRPDRRDGAACPSSPPPRTGCARGCAPGYALKRLEEGEGERALRAARTCAAAASRGSTRTRRGCSSCSTAATSWPSSWPRPSACRAPAGPGLLARLVADLGARGMLADVDAATGETVAPRGWRRLLTPRRIDLPLGAGPGRPALPARGVRALHARRVRARGARAARGAGSVRLPRRRPLRHAVRGREARRAGRRGVRRRALPRGRRCTSSRTASRSRRSGGACARPD